MSFCVFWRLIGYSYKLSEIIHWNRKISCSSITSMLWYIADSYSHNKIFKNIIICIKWDLFKINRYYRNSIKSCSSTCFSKYLGVSKQVQNLFRSSKRKVFPFSSCFLSVQSTASLKGFQHSHKEKYCSIKEKYVVKFLIFFVNPQ